jgi:hypothetical protein
MSFTAQATIQLQADVDKLIAGKGNLGNAAKAMQAAKLSLGQAISTLGEARLSRAAGEAVIEKIKAARSEVRSAQTSVRTVLTRLLGITVQVWPGRATLEPGARFRFSASGDDAGYIWSLNPTGQGSIDQTGLYTAPASEGAVEVIAISKTNSSKAGSAEVTIQCRDVGTEAIAETRKAAAVEEWCTCPVCHTSHLVGEPHGSNASRRRRR